MLGASIPQTSQFESRGGRLLWLQYPKMTQIELRRGRVYAPGAGPCPPRSSPSLPPSRTSPKPPQNRHGTACGDDWRSHDSSFFYDSSFFSALPRQLAAMYNNMIDLINKNSLKAKLTPHSLQSLDWLLSTAASSSSSYMPRAFLLLFRHSQHILLLLLRLLLPLLSPAFMLLRSRHFLPPLPHHLPGRCHQLPHTRIDLPVPPRHISFFSSPKPHVQEPTLVNFFRSTWALFVG